MLPEDDASPLPDWLVRFEPDAWIRRALAELAQAESRLKHHDRVAGVLGLQRAAGMALNGALSVVFRPWGRTYLDHLRALRTDEGVPAPVREAAELLSAVVLERQPGVVRLTPPSEGERWVEAAKTIMAHAYAVVHGRAGRSS
jgi:HEPN domain-containing protein